MIKVAVTGAYGKMGREVMKGVIDSNDLQLVGAIDVCGVGTDVGSIIGLEKQGILITDNLNEVLKTYKPEVLIDFTYAETGFLNCFTAIMHGVSPVSGTTGMSDSQIKQLQILCEEKQVGAVIASNFALGAIIMMRLCSIAATYFSNVEIIELHHDQKIDSPSGTSLSTAEVILNAQEHKVINERTEIEKVEGARGAEVGGIHIHSVRLPGLIAHQEVIFGGSGQSLSIRHDSYGRESFIPGVLLAVRKVQDFKCLIDSLNTLI